MLNKIMENMNVDAIFITDMYNLRYFTGFTGTTGVALATKNGNFFFSDFRYKEQGAKQVEPNGFQFVEVGRNSLDKVKEKIDEFGVKKIGFEDLNVTFSYYKKLEELFAVSMYPLGDSLVKQRLVKKDYEIENIKKAIEISDMAFSETLKIVKVGITEKEIAAHLEYIQRKLGAENRSFDTIVASGYRSALPHGVASDKKVGMNELVTTDFGAYYNGYVSDMTRTFFVGDEISDKQKEIYDIVLEANKMAIKQVKAGMKCSDLDKVARDYIASKGYGDNFGHGLGHGIGLEIHEAPTVSPAGDIILEENMLITIEPGIYIDGFSGVRIEDDVIVKKDGCVVLNKSNKELIMIK